MHSIKIQDKHPLEIWEKSSLRSPQWWVITSRMTHLRQQRQTRLWLRLNGWIIAAITDENKDPAVRALAVPPLWFIRGGVVRRALLRPETCCDFDPLGQIWPSSHNRWRFTWCWPINLHSKPTHESADSASADIEMLQMQFLVSSVVCLL